MLSTASAAEPRAPCHEKDPLPGGRRSRGVQPTVQEVQGTQGYAQGQGCPSLGLNLPYIHTSFWVPRGHCHADRAEEGWPWSPLGVARGPQCMPSLPPPGGSRVGVQKTGWGLIAPKSLSGQSLVRSRGLGGQRGEGLRSGAHSSVKRARMWSLSPVLLILLLGFFHDKRTTCLLHDAGNTEVMYEDNHLLSLSPLNPHPTHGEPVLLHGTPQGQGQSHLHLLTWSQKAQKGSWHSGADGGRLPAVFRRRLSLAPLTWKRKGLSTFFP